MRRTEIGSYSLCIERTQPFHFINFVCLLLLNFVQRSAKSQFIIVNINTFFPIQACLMFPVLVSDVVSLVKNYYFADFVTIKVLDVISVSV